MRLPKLKLRRRRTEGGGGAYFHSAKTDIQFITSGCKWLDCVLGGGWPLGRVVNIVGDKSTGKTLLAIEASANFLRQYPGWKMYYCEAESAFDKKYAQALGMPIKDVTFIENCDTVEDVFEALQEILKRHRSGPSLFIVDSLDALSDRAEQGRKIDETSYGTGKAKQMSQLFRRLIKPLAESQICVMIISQVRDNIGVTFGRKTTRSGGRALDFYASQVLYLAQMGAIKKTVNKMERTIGVKIKAKCEKNKISMPLRECVFTVRFGYGIDDLEANLEFLSETDRLGELEISNKAHLPLYLRRVNNMLPIELIEERQRIESAVEKVWYEIEEKFLPKRRKYAN